MDVCRAKHELRQMAKAIKKDANLWRDSMQKGRATMRLIATAQLKIFRTENRLSNINNSREMHLAEIQLRKSFESLKRPHDIMQKQLQNLKSININTQRMLSRVRLWSEDELIGAYRIARGLSTQQLLEFLQFLASRYDAEYEVKEMVVLELERIGNSYDLNIMLKAWNHCVHAGDQEFNVQYKAFCAKSSGRQILNL